ncbi:MAG: hypothetical protein ACREHG_01835, partial [Candidatus Saccharimonadales bacterium]
DGHITLILDSTQLVNFSMCPTYWNYSDCGRLQLTTAHARPAMKMGTFGHYLFEKYYKGIANGYSKSKALESAMDAIPHEFTDPLESDKVEIVRKRVIEYVYTYLNSDFELTCSAGGIECGFTEKLYEDSKRLYILEGKIDILAAKSGSSVFVVDHKFQLSRKALYKKSIQFRNYSMVANATMLMINYVRLTQKVDATTYQRDISTFTAQDHAQWKQSLINKYDAIAEYLRFKDTRMDVGAEQYRNRSSCSGQYGALCPYIMLCDEPNAAISKSMETTMYTIREAWKPWENLEES